MVEKKKKQFDIQTYREIIAFTEGEGLDEIAKAREEGKKDISENSACICSGNYYSCYCDSIC